MMKSIVRRADGRGWKHTKEFKAWVSMRYRCLNPTHPSFAEYGGRGITVCQRWQESFANFVEDMGLAPTDHSLHRVDNNGPYAPWNCRWASRSVQQQNRRNSLWVTYEGKRMALAAAASAAGINRLTVYARIRAGKPESEWLTLVAAAAPQPKAERRPRLRKPAAERDRSKERSTYEAMRSRCYNPNNPSWADYGGRGIKVCERWLGSYAAFLEDMGPAPEEMTLERIRVNEDYGPDNCRWATWKEQQRNRRTTPFVTFNGERMALSEAAEKAGMKYITVHMRWRRGWPEDRLFEPASHRRPQSEWVMEGTTDKRRTSKVHRKAVLGV